MGAQSTLLDLETALARVGGDHDLLKEIAELFLGDYPGHLAALARGIASEDAPTVEKAAHTIKGSVATFGADSVVAAALSLERAGRGRDLAHAPELYQDLQALLAGLHVELQHLLQ